MQKRSFLFSVLFLLSFWAVAQDSLKQHWVDSVYQSLSVKERFGQLLMVRANHSSKSYDPQISQYIQEYNIGGVCFFKSTPQKQRQQTNLWQAQSSLPLLVSIDAEWGLGMRLKQTISYPFQMTLGSITNDSLIYEMGKQIGQQCRRLGIHLNFAPVVDINNNPNNPVINSRSFGDDPKKVAQKAAMYMQGLQDAQIIATAKHFPGHGDTETDSHKTLPIVAHDKNRLEAVELYPYKQLINRGLSGVMVAHLYVPAYEKEKNVATTLSKAVVSDLLQDQLGFKGLVVTDALDMKGVTKYFPSGEIEVRALLAGNDILLLPENTPMAIKGLFQAYESGRIPPELLKEKCKKILAYKYDLGLTQKQEVSEENLISDLNKPEDKALREILFDHAITLIENKNVLPLARQGDTTLAVISFGMKKNAVFEKTAKKYTEATFIYLPKTLSIEENAKWLDSLRSFNYVLFNIGGTTIFPQRSFGITASQVELINKTAQQNEAIINLLGSPLAMQEYFNTPDDFAAFVLSHQDNSSTQKLSAEKIFGASGFMGVLPLKISEKYPASWGLQTQSLGFLKEGNPALEQVNGADLEKNIDSLVQEGIQMSAFPGCQICVVKGGRIIFQKSYGFQTYDSVLAINDSSIYDIASITKVTASIPALMYLYDRGQLDLDAPIENYFSYLEHTNKAKLNFRDILTHQAQLTSWIPFYWYNTDSLGNLNPEVFQTQQSDIFNVRVAEDLYINHDYKYQIFDTIIKSDLRDKREYKYSDLGYYFVPSLMENTYNISLDKFVMDHFYKPLGLKNTFFHPLKYKPISQIVPTENDTLFRKQIIRGDVHDPGAAMLGGVCGHAGLFSTAKDLAVIFQMYLQEGYYNGVQYFDSATIAEFTRYQHDGIKNRRALGFDKPFKKYDKYGPVCKSASLNSYGHSGFTGTYAWVDPDYDLVYIFLSNRVFPRSDNYKISKFDFRTNIQQAIYDAMR